MWYSSCDTVVIAIGSKADQTLVDELKVCGKNIEVIGDAKQTREAIDVIYEESPISTG